jgi:hypothetical protein
LRDINVIFSHCSVCCTADLSIAPIGLMKELISLVCVAIVRRNVPTEQEELDSVSEWIRCASLDDTRGVGSILAASKLDSDFHPQTVGEMSHCC